ncbi:uncharacterized protein BJ171DRAFT_427489 [Polychytrium aggregatum]|uniref:uncharacterized protein n=1 Tax=Polychytrium aggregatum TaxID=110093 RepID=UPI0022FDED27|nr:uncharacterized protein BJ171DRAFT_427489 [Polychytrium aggregatum]KAI9199641.1 hypothetical protein BJ171DRAFT_427489 [Polychytrium aggregatum]
MASGDLSAFVLGPTGMVGKKLVSELLHSPRFSKVTTIHRRAFKDDEKADFPKTNSKLVEKIVDFDKLEEHREYFRGHDVGFCCLGTTRADAGSAENFVKIDHDYVLKSAQLYHAETEPGKPSHFVLLTSAGSNKCSYFLYPRTKGLLEFNCANLGFDRLTILRPGLLDIGQDRRPSSRPLEHLGHMVYTNLLTETMRKTLGISTGNVAAAMRKVAEDWIASKHSPTVVQIYENNDLHELLSKI